MSVFTIDDPEHGVIRYTDHKRHLWLLSALFPLWPFVGMGLVAWSGQEWMLWLPLGTHLTIGRQDDDIRSQIVNTNLDYMFTNSIHLLCIKWSTKKP